MNKACVYPWHTDHAAAAHGRQRPRRRDAGASDGVGEAVEKLISFRQRLDRAPAMKLSGRKALDMAGIGIADLDFIDLYSCFPSAVEVACDELGLAYVFISHDLAVVRFISDEVLVMKDGVVVEQASAAQILAAPREAYTQRLLAASIARFSAASSPSTAHTPSSASTAQVPMKHTSTRNAAMASSASSMRGRWVEGSMPIM